MRLAYTCSRLWRYLGVYFLKPFDALNDTVASNILLQLDWPDEYIEIGSGDGLFSFILHRGTLPLAFDRYIQIDLAKSDIYDTHIGGRFPLTNPPKSPKLLTSIDASRAHADKVSELGYSCLTLCSSYEDLPLPDNATEAIFYYIPHGLKDHSQAMHEARRVLAPGGRMLILLYDSSVNNSFFCYKIGKSLKGRWRDFFLGLDNGRHDELTSLAKTQSEWVSYFAEHGFQVEDSRGGLSPNAWKLYDIQTRPVLKPLIRSFNFLPPQLRTLIKLMWMLAWYPILICCLALFGAKSKWRTQKTCFLAFQLGDASERAFELAK